MFLDGRDLSIFRVGWERARDKFLGLVKRNQVLPVVGSVYFVK